MRLHHKALMEFLREGGAAPGPRQRGGYEGRIGPRYELTELGAAIASSRCCLDILKAPDSFRDLRHWPADPRFFKFSQEFYDRWKEGRARLTWIYRQADGSRTRFASAEFASGRPYPDTVAGAMGGREKIRGISRRTMDVKSL